jgi:hypothetical protein
MSDSFQILRPSSKNFRKSGTEGSNPLSSSGADAPRRYLVIASGSSTNPGKIPITVDDLVKLGERRRSFVVARKPFPSRQGACCLRTLQTREPGTADGTSCISARPRGCEGWFSAAPLLVTGRRPAKNSRIPEPLAMHRLASHGRKPQGFSATASAELGIPRKR